MGDKIIYQREDEQQCILKLQHKKDKAQDAKLYKISDSGNSQKKCHDSN